MTCNKGIYKVSKKELNDYADGKIKAIHSTVYGVADGLRSAECNFATDPSIWKGFDGRIWFATTSGIASVDPRQRQIINADPIPIIEDVLVNQHPVPFYHGVAAGPGGGDLEIQFTTSDFVAPERIRFRYRLVGSDTDWIMAGTRRQAFYTKLPPRHYRFEVQAADESHDWSPAGAPLDIRLRPHFWQTNSFKALCVMTLLLAAAVIYRLRVHYLVAHNRLLEVRVQERTGELEVALKAAENAGLALREQASKDGLTGLWNRGSIFEKLNRELERAQRDRLEIAVLMVDLDHFKMINDTYGHQVGDQVLQGVAERFTSLTRSYDFVGRYGGEEFVIVLPGCSLEDGIKRASEFGFAVTETPILTTFGPINVTCSFGVAESIRHTTVDELIKKADEGLYCAKKAGRNCVRAVSLQER
jgi:diguanylate cyclase (GGDEF)-like protein